MFEQVRRHILPEWIKNERDTLAPGQLGRWHEVAVIGDEDDGVCLFLQRDRGDVKSNPHVNALLAQVRHEVRVLEIGHFNIAVQEKFLRPRLQNPRPL